MALFSTIIFLIHFFLISNTFPKKISKEDDFRTYTICKHVNRVFSHTKCLKQEPLGKGAKSLAFQVNHKGEDMIFLLQKQNSTSTIEMLNKIGPHPNIIKIHKHKIRSEWSYFLMEVGHLGSLSDFRRAQKQRFRNSTFVMEIFDKIVEGARFINSKGFVHSDLKLGNIVIDKFYQPKIIDFELATRNGVRYGWRGTNSYMAPEILKLCFNETKREYNEKVDVFSLGVILIRMMTGGYPFNGATREESYRNITSNDFALTKGLPIEIAEILEGCLKFDPLERWSFDILQNKIDLAINKPSGIFLYNFDAFSTFHDHVYIEKISLFKWTPEFLLAFFVLVGGMGRWSGGLFLKSSYFGN